MNRCRWFRQVTSLISRCNAGCTLVSNEPVFPSYAGGLCLLVHSFWCGPHFTDLSCFYLLIFLRNSSKKWDWLDSTSCSASVVAQESWKATQMSSHLKRWLLISFPNSSLMWYDDTYNFSLYFSVMNIILNSLTSNSGRTLSAAQGFGVTAKNFREE